MVGEKKQLLRAVHQILYVQGTQFWYMTECTRYIMLVCIDIVLTCMIATACMIYSTGYAWNVDTWHGWSSISNGKHLCFGLFLVSFHLLFHFPLWNKRYCVWWVISDCQTGRIGKVVNESISGRLSFQRVASHLFFLLQTELLSRLSFSLWLNRFMKMVEWFSEHARMKL